MKKTSLAEFKVWSILYPLLMYWAMVVLVMFVAQQFLGDSTQMYMLCEIIASGVTLPIIYVMFYRPDHLGKNVERNGKRIATHILCILFITVSVSVALNNILCMSPLAAASAGFAEANSKFFGSTLALELIGSAFLTPILEELIYRGVIFERLRKMMGCLPAVVLSALLFAIMHFNWVQFIFAFLIGMLLALFVEKTGHVYGAIVAHMASNFLAVVRTETGLLECTLDGTPAAWLISLGIGLIGVAALLLYLKKMK